MAPQKPLVVPAQGRHSATLIVAHGLGDAGAGWYFLAQELVQTQKFDHVKFVFPNAPSIPITLNGGMSMPGWYDITSLGSINRTEDEAGIMRSQKYFHDLIDDEVSGGISSERIVLGGFSQGGAMSLMAGLTCPQKLGGIMGLSCYLLLRDKIQGLIAEKGDANKETKIFMGHGNVDQVVKHEFGQLTANTLKEWGYNVDFRTYSGLGHSAAPQELKDIESFLESSLPPLPAEQSNQGSL